MGVYSNTHRTLVLHSAGARPVEGGAAAAPHGICF